MSRREQADFGNYMSDCIHLHACRCLHKRYRMAGRKYVARECNERCMAYQRARKVYLFEPSTALEWARDGARMIRAGYDEYDTWCMGDIPFVEAYVIENGDNCSDDDWEDA